MPEKLSAGNPISSVAGAENDTLKTLRKGMGGDNISSPNGILEHPLLANLAMMKI